VPRPVVLSVWLSEALRHSELKVAVVQLGQAKLETAIASDADLVVIPWSGLQSIMTSRRPKDPDHPRGGLVVNYDLIHSLAGRFDLAVIDEIHTAKNYSTLRFRIAAALTEHCTAFMGLTGTPFGRDPFALWSQAFLCDRGNTLSYNPFFFRTAFGKELKGYLGTELVFDTKKKPILEKKLASISLSYGWEGNIDMPPINKSAIGLEMGPEQRHHYNAALSEMFESGRDDNLRVENVFVKLRQISSGLLPYYDDNGVRSITLLKDNPKLDWITEFFEEAPREACVVLFHDFTITGQLVCRQLAKMEIPHVWLYGGSKNRPEIMRKFQSGEVNVFVANAATGSEGIDLSRADYLCFLESPLSCITRNQAEARPMSASRADRPLFIDDLVCSPVERRILGFIREGRTLLASMIYNELRAAPNSFKA
jgi:hypothetical protein